MCLVPMSVGVLCELSVLENKLKIRDDALQDFI